MRNTTHRWASFAERRRGRKASEKQRWRNLSARPLSVSVQTIFAQMSVRVRTSDLSNNIKVVGQHDRYIEKKRKSHVHNIKFYTLKFGFFSQFGQS
jgi:hypothetical protein